MQYGKTNIVQCGDSVDLGQRAAADVASVMRELLDRQDEIRIIFAAGESQMTFLDRAGSAARFRLGPSCLL